MTRIIYVDSNVFIYAVEGEAEVASLAHRFFIETASAGANLLTSELTLAEVLVRPEKERRPDKKRDFLDLFAFNRSVRLLPVTRRVLIESAAYRATAFPDQPLAMDDRRNVLPDAIHVVSAIHGSATAFVGRDSRIRLPKSIELIRFEARSIEALLERVR